jgi:hypothetical protein
VAPVFAPEQRNSHHPKWRPTFDLVFGLPSP